MPSPVAGDSLDAWARLLGIPERYTEELDYQLMLRCQKVYNCRVREIHDQLDMLMGKPFDDHMTGELWMKWEAMQPDA